MGVFFCCLCVALYIFLLTGDLTDEGLLDLLCLLFPVQHLQLGVRLRRGLVRLVLLQVFLHLLRLLLRCAHLLAEPLLLRSLQSFFLLQLLLVLMLIQLIYLLLVVRKLPGFLGLIHTLGLWRAGSLVLRGLRPRALDADLVDDDHAFGRLGDAELVAVLEVELHILREGEGPSAALGFAIERHQHLGAVVGRRVAKVQGELASARQLQRHFGRLGTTEAPKGVLWNVAVVVARLELEIFAPEQPASQEHILRR
mmetsp:Transcript_73054/g.237621  ORF Transcript_73054/g.237621 Transcript_73054/m.237621 type:complete len:254 (-) Transcript_73054:356-1117(-)